MDLLSPVITGALLAVFTAIQLWINKGRFDAFGKRLDALEERMDRRFEQLSAEIASLRSDLLQVALASGRKDPA